MHRSKVWNLARGVSASAAPGGFFDQRRDTDIADMNEAADASSGTNAGPDPVVAVLVLAREQCYASNNYSVCHDRLDIDGRGAGVR